MTWDEPTIQTLRDLWAQGHSTAEIGRRLGVSKNAIVGKAHRLDLEARPSPIRRDGNALETVLRHVNLRLTQTLQRLPSLDVPLPIPSEETKRADRVAVRNSTPLPASAPPLGSPAPIRAPTQPAPLPVGRVIECCWPLGQPGTKAFHFCDASSLPGKPYCGAHAKLAYVRVRDRKEDAV